MLKLVFLEDLRFFFIEEYEFSRASFLIEIFLNSNFRLLYFLKMGQNFYYSLKVQLDCYEYDFAEVI